MYVDPAVVDNVPRCSRSKKPRLHHRPSRPARLSKKGLIAARPPPVDRLGNDLEDHGIINATSPGPSTGSLLNLRRRTPPIITVDSSAALDLPIPIDIVMAHVPSTHPYVSRNTLKELDLDVILRNPQLPYTDIALCLPKQATTSCLTMACNFGRHALAVNGSYPKPIGVPSFEKSNQLPPPNPIVGYCPALRVVTVRTPSRIRPLLAEFLEVLLLVIQPLQSVSGMYVNPDSFKAQMQEHSIQADYIRSIFDPALVEQQLRHDIFDPSSLLRVIGSTLKGHCAPMRDKAVEDMVRAAETCSPGGNGTKADAVNAVRACFDILELMKLDIANHQLQSLRLSISRTSAVYEFQNFRARSSACHTTRQWLKSSTTSLSSRISPIPHPHYPHNSIDFHDLGRNRQIYLSVLKGLTDLVFYSPVAASESIPGARFWESSNSCVNYPETLYLDQVRLGSLSRDLDDIVVSYMLLLLFRQLIHASESEEEPSSITSRPPLSRLDDATLLKIKNEITVINSSRVGHLLLPAHGQVAKDGNKFADFKDNIVLHIAKRAQQFRNPPRNTNSSLTSAFSPLLNSPITPSCIPPATNDDTATSSCSPPSHSFSIPPDPRIVNLASRWIAENISLTSSLFSVIYNRLHEAVFAGVVAQAYPGRQYTTGQLFSSAIESSAPLRQGGQPYSMPLVSGMEPLADELRTLTEKIARVAVIHLNAYTPIYECNGFLET
ncbi:hypothetical protein D9757_003525 [Collybiopsis confluens]|uniref:Tcp11-domain-containing protein n=1 Tax=Collybiopsis confluens TaxID=2823264 RepID=A0A8H5HTG8_9AGAR|nr:hypothetical protein D9757_003525 [Collybiopsis confluens]